MPSLLTMYTVAVLLFLHSPIFSEMDTIPTPPTHESPLPDSNPNSNSNLTSQPNDWYVIFSLLDSTFRRTVASLVGLRGEDL